MSNLVVLVGYMGSGKSTLGEKLAKEIDVPFADLDQLIEQAEGKSVPEIFEKHGVLYFRKREKEVLESALREKPKGVLAVGGGTPCYYDNMNLINMHALSIYLRANVPKLANRLFPERYDRPLIKELESLETLQEFIGKHLFERKDFYEKAHKTIDVGSIHIDQALQKCLQIVHQRNVAE